MTLSKSWLWAGLGLLLPALAAAQGPIRTQASEQPPAQSRQVYEDIEIMRRIINRELGRWPGLVSLNSNCTLCHVASGNHVRSSEGKFGDFTGSTGISKVQAGTATTLRVAVSDFDQDGWMDV